METARNYDLNKTMNGPLASSYFPSGAFWPWLGFSYPSALSEEKPLDLSIKLNSISNQLQIRSSVIQSTKDYTEPYLPTCSPPEISLSPPESDKNPKKCPSSASSSEPSPNRMSYPREFKLMVIDYFYTNGLNKYRTCKEFQITKSMLNGWLTKADKIRQSRPGALKSGRSGRKPQFPAVEKQLYELYLEKVNQGEKIGNRWLRETARNLAAELYSSKELNGMCQFSERWLSNFKRRFNIGLRAEPGRSGSVYSSAGEDSQKAIKSEEEDALSTCSEEQPSESSVTSSTTAQMAQAVLQQSGQLPIRAFYEKFPWLCKKVHHQTEDSASEEKTPRGRKVQFPEVEKILYERIQQEPHKVSNKWLQEKAREIAKDLNVTDEQGKPAVFSEHWLLNFKKRFNLSKNTDL